MTARVLLVYDTPGWACESECKALAKHLALNAPGALVCTLAGTGAVSKAQLAQYDLVFSTIYYHLAEASHPRSVSQVSSYSYWVRKGWPGGWPHLAEWRYMVAKNAHLESLLGPADHPRITRLYHPFDHEFWLPEPRTGADDAFVVGFAGHRQDLKGLPMIEMAISTLPGVKLLAPTWERGRIPFADMPKFYQSLDAYVCMSQPGQDAGPRPPIEAGLCGVPVITTKAGQIGEMVEDGVNGLVIQRSVEALREAISRLRADVQLRRRLAATTRDSFVQRWVMDVGRAWTSYFEDILAT